MKIERILSDLRAKQRALETAISALESLQKKERMAGTLNATRKRNSPAWPRKKRETADISTKAAVGANSGELIPFPAVSRRTRSRRSPNG